MKKPKSQAQPANNTRNPKPPEQAPKPEVVTFGFEVEPMPTLVVDKPPLKIAVSKETVKKIVEKIKDL
jgi:hypothetical protein